LKKTYNKIALGLVALAILFAVVSFLRENWSANERPGVVETILARLFLSRSRSAGDILKNPIEPTTANLDEGRRLYEKQCAFCHGLDGKGQGATGLQFYPPVPALAGRAADGPADKSIAWSDGQLQSILNNGIRYTAMPSFARELSPEETWKVVLWVRHLSERPYPAQGILPPGPAAPNASEAQKK
jgi:mono/diheme cytochrome c family protein